jgi:hypothetical protein
MGGKDDGAKLAREARADEVARQGRIRAGTERVNDIFGKNFGDKFFTDRKNAFLNYATPQLSDQYADANKQLVYSLDRSGLTDSSARGEKYADLQKMYDLNQQKVADDALALEGQSRGQVEDARANLIQTLNATGDAEGAANSAITRSQALTKPAAFSPLENLFVDFTRTLGVQAAQERAQAASDGAYQARYDTGLFGPRGGTVQIRK